MLLVFLKYIYDPRNWDMLNVKIIEILAGNGPKRDLSIVKSPKNKVHRRFVSSCYSRELPNGETSDRKWLVYSKELDKVFCFCCKFFKKGTKKSASKRWFFRLVSYASKIKRA